MPGAPFGPSRPIPWLPLGPIGPGSPIIPYKMLEKFKQLGPSNQLKLGLGPSNQMKQGAEIKELTDIENFCIWQHPIRCCFSHSAAATVLIFIMITKGSWRPAERVATHSSRLQPSITCMPQLQPLCSAALVSKFTTLRSAMKAQVSFEIELNQTPTSQRVMG